MDEMHARKESFFDMYAYSKNLTKGHKITANFLNLQQFHFILYLSIVFEICYVGRYNAWKGK